jgi:hypothetical protein
MDYDERNSNSLPHSAALESGSVRIAAGAKGAETLIHKLRDYELRSSESGFFNHGAVTGGSFDHLVKPLILFSPAKWSSSNQVLFW